MEITEIDSGQSFDFGKTAASYAKYRDIYPQELYGRLRELGVAADGTAWLDLGTGTGVLPKNLYNPKAAITGVDISADQIAFAKSEAETNEWNITYYVSPAEKTGLPDHSFNTVTAAQCFWYFNRDAMQTELRRLLKPGGLFIKIFMNWELQDPIAAKSIALVEEFNPKWNGGTYGAADLYDDLFPGRHTETFFSDLPFTRDSWHGRMRACRGTLASMDESTFRQWETAHLTLLEHCPTAFTVRHKLCISWFEVS